MDSKIKVHKQLCDYLNDIYKAKNSDYGDSFAKVRQEYPEAIIIRLMDKLERLKTLYKQEAEPAVWTENIGDTLIDLANYCLLELVERQFGGNSKGDKDA